MFSKLKFKLIFFNMLIVGFLILLIGLMIFWGSPHVNISDVTDEMWGMALEGTIQDINPHSHQHITHKRKSLILLQLDNQNQLLNTSPSATKMDTKLLNNLIEQALSSPSHSGQITSQTGEIYPFVKVSYNSPLGTVLVFRDLRLAKLDLISYGFKLIGLIILSVFLVFLGSLFLSSKALVPICNAWQKQLDFSADASHELRTPIAAIQANTELILSNSDETVASQKKWLHSILKESKRMASLIEDLLLLSRADSGQLLLVKTPFLFDQAIKEALEPMEPLALESHIAFELKLEPRVHFIGDINRIKELIIILVDNAIKYMNRPGSIEITLKQTKHKIKLLVADNGEGIAPDAVSHLFDRFYRVDKTRSRHKGGAGLGLSIAKWIVQEHSGHITVESMLGKGTRFLITLPLN